MRRGRSDIEGFWQTLGWPAASVDFCESNYESSRYVAEPINALSALPYLYFGWYGASAIRGGDAWEQTAFRLAFRCLFLIGVGTFALHATLTAPAQALDEIPMLLLSLDLMFLMSQVNAGATPAPSWLPNAACAVAVAVIAVYLQFQALYEAFLLVYTTSVFGLIIGAYRMAHAKKGEAVAEKVRTELVRPLFHWALAWYLGGGSAAWLAEMLFCDAISRVVGPAFLHPVWHCSALAGTWCCIQMLRAARVSARDHLPVLLWEFGGYVPVVYYGQSRSRPVPQPEAESGAPPAPHPAPLPWTGAHESTPGGSSRVLGAPAVEGEN